MKLLKIKMKNEKLFFDDMDERYCYSVSKSPGMETITAYFESGSLNELF